MNQICLEEPQFNIDKIKNLWGLTKDIIFIRKVANWIYYYPDKNLYIRVTDHNHRSLDQIRGEIDWIKHVNSHGINSIKAIPSNNNQLVETINSNNKSYYVTCFTAAPGNRLPNQNISKDILLEWGKITSRLHIASQSYKPDPNCKRNSWEHDTLQDNITNNRLLIDGLIYEKSFELEEKFKTLPKDKEYFGLMHADLHSGNFNVENNKITIFDFDDSMYCWFIYDISVIFWSLSFSDADNNVSRKYFFEGYNRFKQIDEFWMNQINLFYDYRNILMFYLAINEIQKSKNSINIFKKIFLSVYEYFKISPDSYRSELKSILNK